MSEDNGEYEVESVVAAKVAKEEPTRRKKKPQLVWRYRVRWKGYSPDDDTWEPVESFAHSKQTLEAFWSRVSTNGRDKDDLRLFKFGEEVFPSGPPTHKKARKSNLPIAGASQAKDDHAESSQTSQTNKRLRSPDLEIVEAPPPKKKAREASIEIISPPPTQAKGKVPATPLANTSTATPSRTRSQRRKAGPRHVSPEVVPPSDGELDEDAMSKGFIFNSNTSASVINISTSPGGQSSSLQKPKYVAMPELPSRSTASRIQKMDAPGLMIPDGALSAKHNAMKLNPKAAEQLTKPAKRMKAGPGRSSTGFIASNSSTLLTSEKGVLKSVRPRRSHAAIDKYTPEPEVTIIDDPQEVVPPTGGELLQVSGLRKEDAEALEDFDEDMQDVAAVEAAVEPQTPDLESPSTPLATRIRRVTQQIFPAQSSEPDVDAKLMKTSTIFGPLGIGSSTAEASQLASHQVSLSLDSSLSIPVVIVDPSNDEAFSSFETASGAAPPGKFYSLNAGNLLLASVKPSGASALVELSKNASDEERVHFSAFSTRLHEGDLFVTFTGSQSWIYCSSNSTMASRQLDVPSELLNESNKLLVSKIEIMHYTGYADAAAEADDRRWSQYLASITTH